MGRCRLHRGPHRDVLIRMIGELVLVDLYIGNGLDRDHSHAVRRLNAHPLLTHLFSLQPGDGLAQLHGKVEVANRFQQVVHGVHLVALQRILRYVGGEDQDAAAVLRPHPPRCFHAVHQRHLDVHKDNVILRGAFVKQGQSVLEMPDPHLRARLSGKTAQMPRQLGVILHAVLQNGDVQHTTHSPFRRQLPLA